MGYILQIYLYKDKHNHKKQGKTVATPESIAV